MNNKYNNCHKGKGFGFIAAGIILIMMGLGLTRPYKHIFIISGVISIVYAIIYMLWDRLIKTKIVRHLGLLAVKVAGRISRILKDIIRKFSMSGSAKFGNARYITGYEDTMTRAGRLSGEKKRRKKKKRLKNMDSKEKIRYIYEKRVEYAVKKGVKIKKHMTPRQIGDEMSERELFEEDNYEFMELYNYIRYDEKADADEALEDMKATVNKQAVKS